MKLRTITLFAGLLVAQVSLAQVEEVGSVIDTTTTVPVITTVEQATSEAELKTQKEQLKACSLNYKKATSQELRDYFGEVLPAFDRDRVHDSDIRKLIQWYDILVKNGITNFEEALKPNNGEEQTAEQAAAE